MRSGQTKMKKRAISSYSERMKSEINRIIEKYLPKKVTREWLDFTFGKALYQYSPKAAQKALIEPAWDFLTRGGKRWRPIFFLLITEAIGGDVEKVKDFVIIPELIHNGSIIIDDIEDKGELRRDKPCLHKIFGEDIAINAGNFLYYLPLLTLIKKRKEYEPEILVRAYEAYIQEALNLSFGQATDIYWHRGKQKEISEREYLQMCVNKTGGLLRLTAKLAVIFSKGSRQLAEDMGKIAGELGVAFQIQDDILDIELTGKDREKFGKSFGNDIKEGKRSLMVVHTLEKAKERDKKRLLEILDKPKKTKEEIVEAISIMKKYGSIKYAKKVAKKIAKDAWRKAENILPRNRAKEKLKEFVNFLVERKI